MHQHPGVGELLSLHPAALRRTHEILAELRDGGPVQFVAENGCHAVTRYDDIVSVLRDPARFSSRTVTGPQAGAELIARLTGDVAGRSHHGDGRAARVAAGLARRLGRYREVLLSADPPTHTRHRRAVTYPFSPRRVAQQEPAIRAVAQELIDGFAGAGEVDLVAAYADRLPVIVIAQALGVEKERLTDFRRWSDRMISVVGNPNITDEDVGGYLRALMEFGEYFTGVIARRRADPRNDLITDIATSRVDEGLLEVHEILPMLQQFLVAGNETTGKLISSTVWTLLTHPGLLAAVRADHRRTEAVVDEVLRLHTPVLGLYRQATEDTEVGGCPIPAGSILWLLYPAGNRDERQFPDADRFQLDRPNANKHLAFGHGPHYCIGAALARLEASVAVDALLARLPDLRLARDWTGPVYHPSHVLHGLGELRLEFTPAPR